MKYKTNSKRNFNYKSQVTSKKYDFLIKYSNNYLWKLVMTIHILRYTIRLKNGTGTDLELD